MTFKLSAGIYPYEYVKGTSTFNPVSMTIGASTFASKRGSLGPKLITGGYDEFVKNYGQGDFQWSPAHATLKPALKEMTVFYGNRIVNGALYAGISCFYDSLNKKFFASPFKSGSSLDYINATKVSKLISFSDAIPSAKTVKLDVGSTEITQAFNTTSNYTMSLLATQIQSALDTLGQGGSAQVIKAWNLSDRKQEISLNFNRIFNTGDIVNFSIEGTPGIVKTTISETFDGTIITDAEAFLNKIVSDINANVGLVATVIPTTTPKILVSCANAGSVNLVVTPESSMTTTLSIEVITLKEGHGVYDDRTILVTLPETLDSLEISGTVEDSAVVINVDDNAKILDVFAENPGAWASNMTEGLGIKITNLDQGIQQRQRITINQAIQTGNVFNCSIGYNENTWNISPVTYAVGSDNTLKLIAQAIQNVLDSNLGVGGQAYVEEVTGGIENDRSIMIITPNSSQNIQVVDAIFEGGINQPIAIVKEVIPNTPSTETFDFEVYTRASLAQAAEGWKTSLSKKLNGQGQQMQIDEMINKGAYQSNNIRIKSYTTDFSKLQALDTINWLSGGDDGFLPTIQQITAGWDAFADPEKITVRLLINAGYGDVNVHQKISTIAKTRKDCVAILDMPSDMQKTQNAINYRQYEMNVNTSYAALYSPDILVFDEIQGSDVYIGPSGYVAAQICFTERTRAIWYAPAGLTRGVLSGAKGVRVQYGEGDRDLLEPLQINPILDKKQNGIVIMGEYTTQVVSDPLSDLHTRLLCTNIEIAMVDALAYGLFDPNDEYLRSTMVMQIDNYLKPIKDGRGLRDYRVVSDITKESAADVDLGVAVVNVLLKPVSSTKFIRLNNYILGSGVSFEEVIDAGV